MERTLVTGGAGFIGSHPCDYFVEMGHDVICMDNVLTGSADNVAHLFGKENFRLVKHDVTEYIHIGGELDNVLHFASAASPVDYLEYPIETLKAGSMGAHLLLVSTCCR